MIKDNIKYLVFIFLVVLFFRIVVAYLLPPVQDETYYWIWSKYLDFGYFDHPPMVAWLSWPYNICSPKYSFFCSRLPGVILLALLFFVSLKMFKLCSFNNLESLISFLILSSFNVAALVVGVISTPDVGLTFFYILSLYYGAKALVEDQSNWMWCGIFCGLALLSKYTAVLLVPIFLIAIIKNTFKDLKSPYFYMGIVLMCLVFAPNIIWNYTNNWITFRFQLKHGIQNSYDVGSYDTDLPKPLEITQDSPKYSLIAYFNKKPIKPSSIINYFRIKQSNFILKFLNFILTQLLLWGFLLIPIVVVFYRLTKDKAILKYRLQHINPQIITLLMSAALVPIVFFGIISFKSAIEANWPALYIYPAALLLALFFNFNVLSLLKYAFLNLIILLGFLFYSLYFTPFESLSLNRINSENFGYKELSEYLSTKIQYPIFADRYQLISMLMFYNKNLKVSQYPNISRASEFVRRKELNFYTLQDLMYHKKFFIITTSTHNIPMFETFDLAEVEEIVICKKHNQSELYVIKSMHNTEYISLCPSKSSKKWYLAYYVYKN